MLKELLVGHVNVKESVASWREAIQVAAEPLLQNQFIEKRYIDSMIRNVEENGPYIIIMPGFALPHSRPEEGALKTGLSLLKLQKEVVFPEDHGTSVVVVLAVNDPDIHLDLISELTDILTDDDILGRLFAANTREEILACL